MFVLTICYGAGYLISTLFPNLALLLCFSPEKIFRGQIWRIVTFLLISDGSSLLMTLLVCFCYFSIAKSLEQIIGRFRLNFFVVTGILFLIVFGFIYYFVTGASVVLLPYQMYVQCLRPTYLYYAIFILFALSIPNAEFYLMFFIRIKGKWLIYIDAAFAFLDIVTSFMQGPGYGWVTILMVMATVVNLFLFWGLTKNEPRVPRGRFRAGNKENRSEERTENARLIHRCKICGRNSRSNPELEFRYCSRCIGNYEYCMDHLYTHSHIGVGSEGTE